LPPVIVLAYVDLMKILLKKNIDLMLMTQQCLKDNLELERGNFNMKKLVKKSMKQENILKPYCSCDCGCACRAYENVNSERIDSKLYYATTSGF